MRKQNYSCLWVHLVWGTKKREPLIQADIAHLLHEQLRKIAVEKKYHLNFVNSMPDHIHLLVGYEPKFSVSNIVKDFKGISSHWVNEQQIMEAHFDWQDGYCAISVSPSNLKSVRNYIKNQQKHHLNQSFETEIIDLKNKAAMYC
jgi:putative transposase